MQKPHNRISVGTTWTDAKRRVWEVYETLPFGMARVRTADFSRVGEMRFCDIRAALSSTTGKGDL